VVPARGAAFGDIFNDGHIDLVLNNMDSAPALLRNVVKNGSHWIAFKWLEQPKPARRRRCCSFCDNWRVRQRADVLSGKLRFEFRSARHFGLVRFQD